MRRLFALFLTLSACEPKPANNSTDSDSSDGGGTSGGMSEAWAVGYWYRPGGGLPTSTLATIDVKSDHTAVLFSEVCGNGEKGMKVVGWKSVDADSIEFVSLDGTSSPFFGILLPAGPVRMSRTDKDAVVNVTDGYIANSAYHGDYWRATEHACRVLLEPQEGCEDGSYVRFSCTNGR